MNKFNKKGFTKRSNEPEKPGNQGKKNPKKRFSKPKPKEIQRELEMPDTWPMRLNRFIARSGVCSRRDADNLIEKGLIKVNNKPITELGFKVNIQDVVTYNGKKILPEKPVYVLMNKPKDCITTTRDESGRMTVLDLLKGSYSARLYPVGRLDRNTTGVLLLTNDGELSQKLTHPSFLVRKIYEVTLKEPVTDAQLDMLVKGVELEDGVSYADTAAFPQPQNKRVVGVEIHSGKNRIVRRLFEALGHKVVKLDRVMFGPFIKKGLDRGKFRDLKNSEIAQLHRAKNKL